MARDWREVYAQEWMQRFRLEVSYSVADPYGKSLPPSSFFPDIIALKGPRTLGLSIFAGKHASELRAMLLKGDMAFARTTIPWMTTQDPFIGWDGARVLMEAVWPETLADTEIRNSEYLGKVMRVVRHGNDWLVGVNRRYDRICMSLDPARGSAHYLLSGETQSGKSWALRSMLVQLASSRDNQFVMICVSRKNPFKVLEGMDGMVFPVAKNLGEARIGMRWAADQIGRRLESGPKGRLIVAIDELQTLRDDPTCTSLLKELTSEAAEARINVVAATQRPVVSELGEVGGIIKANMGGRIALRTPDVQGSVISLGVAGAESRLNTLQGQGDAIVRNSNIREERVQISYFTEDEIRTFVAGSRKGYEFPSYSNVPLISRKPEPAAAVGSSESDGDWFTPEQVCIALILRARGHRADRTYGRQRLLRILEDAGFPMSDHRAKYLLKYVDRIFEILLKNNEEGIVHGK
jgi:hypothetical protein